MTRLGLLSINLIACALIQGQITSYTKDQPEPRVDMSESQTIPFITRGEIDFKGSYGEVRVEGWDRPEVAITMTKSLRTDDSPRDRAKSRRN